MLTDVSNFSPPREMAAWLACACFVIWFLMLVDKAIGRVRGKPPASELEARIKALEDWRSAIIRKMESDKMEILLAGEEREKRLSKHVETATERIDSLQATITGLPTEFFAMLANAKTLWSKGNGN
jgi:hypothetical protein